MIELFLDSAFGSMVRMTEGGRTVRNWWSGLGRANQIALIALIVAILAAAPTYLVLFEDPKQEPGPSELRPLDCSRSRTFVSRLGEQKALVDFRNESPRSVEVNWINYEGKREYYYDLGPGETYRQDTFENHPWLIADDSHKCLMVFLPTREPKYAIVR
jgi:hypothetical protein